MNVSSMTQFTAGCVCVTSMALAGAASGQSAITLFDGGGDFFTGAPAGFTFGDFTGNVTETPTSLIIDVADFGGVGLDVPETAFDAGNFQFRLVYRELANNAAGSFNLVLQDNDGDDSGPGLGAEQFQYVVDTSFASDLGDGSGFSEQFVPLNSVFRQQVGGFANDGDGIENFGLFQFQVQSSFGSTTPLNIELQTLELVPIPEPGTMALALGGLGLMVARRRRLM